MLGEALSSTHVQNDTLQNLEKNKVKALLLPPHSSHILQPLDRFTFSQWKKLRKRISFSNPLSDHSRRILIGIKALAMSSTVIDVITAFERSGIVLNPTGNTIAVKIIRSRVSLFIQQEEDKMLTSSIPSLGSTLAQLRGRER